MGALQGESLKGGGVGSKPAQGCHKGRLQVIRHHRVLGSRVQAGSPPKGPAFPSKRQFFLMIVCLVGMANTFRVWWTGYTLASRILGKLLSISGYWYLRSTKCKVNTFPRSRGRMRSGLQGVWHPTGTQQCSQILEFVKQHDPEDARKVGSVSVFLSIN